MKLTERQFCKKFNLEIQFSRALRRDGILAYTEIPGKRVTVQIDENEFYKLVEGEDFVRCPNCQKGMAFVNGVHYRKCKPAGEKLYSKRHLINRKKTEEQKQYQSQVLQERFKTPEGEITRQEIREASIRCNSDPEFLEQKSRTQKKTQNRLEVKENRSQIMTEVWQRPEVIGNREQYVEDHKEELRESIDHARSFLTRGPSREHLRLKEAMVSANIKGFLTEHKVGFYKIDEANPELKIAIEYDGCYWHDCHICFPRGGSGQSKFDRARNSFLQNRGWLVIRVWGHEVKSDLQAVICKIKSAIKSRTVRWNYLKNYLRNCC